MCLLCRCILQCVVHRILPRFWHEGLSHIRNEANGQFYHSRNRAYADRKYREPPTIESAASHPFMKELQAQEGGKTSDSEPSKAEPGTASEQPSRSAASRSDRASPAAASKAAPTSAPATSSPAPVAPLFDLLSMDDVSPWCFWNLCC